VLDMHPRAAQDMRSRLGLQRRETH